MKISSHVRVSFVSFRNDFVQPFFLFFFLFFFFLFFFFFFSFLFFFCLFFFFLRKSLFKNVFDQNFFFLFVDRFSIKLCTAHYAKKLNAQLSRKYLIHIQTVAKSKKYLRKPIIRHQETDFNIFDWKIQNKSLFQILFL